MSVLDIAPNFSVRETISHVVDSSAVMGFRGRNTVYGHEAVILKGPEIPRIRDGPAVSAFVIPSGVAEEVIEGDDTHLYVLDDHYVYYATLPVLEDAQVHTGTSRGENVTGSKVLTDDLHRWAADAVEVTLE